MLALKQSRVSKANGVVRHFKKLGVRVVLTVTATSAVIYNLATAKDAPTFVESIIEFASKLEKFLNRVTPIFSFYLCFIIRMLLIRATFRTCLIQRQYL